MTIVQALKESAESGKAYMRVGDDGYGGWIRYDPEWTYKLSAPDLMADDWELAIKETE